MGSYSLTTSALYQQQLQHTHRNGQNGNSHTNIELPAQTIVTSQPRSVVQTISSSQLEAKSTVQALIHQPNNHYVHPRKDTVPAPGNNSSSTSHVLAITPSANHHGDKSMLITCAKHDCLQVSTVSELKGSKEKSIVVL